MLWAQIKLSILAHFVGFSSFQAQPSMNTTGVDFGPPPTWVFVVFSIAGLFCLLAVGLSTFLLAQHLRHFTVPNQQRYIVRIVLIVPLYAIYSFLCMLFVGASVYLAILRDTYEAFCFLQFFKLCAFFVGGEEELATQLAGEPMLKLPFPLQRWTVTLGPKVGFRGKKKTFS